MPSVELQLAIERADVAYAATAWLTLPDGQGPRFIAAHVPVVLDQATLRAAALNPLDFGRDLAAMLFADGRLRDAWRAARYAALGAQIALRLRLELADDLQGLSWEALCDPETGRPLARDPQVLLSRSLSPLAPSLISASAEAERTALVVVAAPDDLAAYALEAVDAAAEVALAGAALGPIPTTFLAHVGNRSRATLDRLLAALSQGPSVLYLACPIRMVEGQAYLWLEDDNGASNVVACAELARRIGDLACRPVLLVLAAYGWGAPSPGANPLALAGRALAESAAGALVVLPGGGVSSDKARLVVQFFLELARDGLVDRAVAGARSALESDWWQSVLFMRLANGALWRALGSELAICPACGAENEQHDRFCDNCGADLAEEVTRGQLPAAPDDGLDRGLPPPYTAAPTQPDLSESRAGLDAEVARLPQVIAQLEQLQAILGADTPPAIAQSLAEARAALAQASAQGTAAPVPAPGPAAADVIRPRRLDAAMPGLVGLGQKVYLRVQIRLPEQPPVSALDWPAATRPASVDQQSTPMRVVFPAHPLSGELQPVALSVRVVADAFRIDHDEEELELPPDDASPMLRFELVAQAIGSTEVTVQARSQAGRLLGAAFIGAEVSTTAPTSSPIHVAQATLSPTVVAALPTLVLSLGQAGDRLEATMTLLHADGRTPTELATGAPVTIDEAELLQVAFDSRAYGMALAAQVFAAPQLHGAWREACAFADGAGSPLRVRLQLGADWLHQLHWETLCDPDRKTPVALGTRFLLSRYIASADMRTVALPPHQLVRGALVIASPADLPDFDLAPIAIEQDVAVARESFGTLPTTVYAAYAGAQGRATLWNIETALNHGAQVLYLVCHGALVDDEPYLWLERDDGTSDRLPGSTLVEVIEQAAVQPLLVVLVSCQSAGDGQHRALLALGPRLARAGVPAVIGFQGPVTLDTARHMLAPLLAELRAADGVIDRAMGLARAGLRQGPWWQAVLWLRVGDGRLWTASAPPG